MEDQQSGPGDLTTEDDAAAATGEDPGVPAMQRRRRLFSRRTKPEVADGLTPEAGPGPRVADTPRKPVGKAARAARTDDRQEDSHNPDAPSAAGEAPTEETAEQADAPSEVVMPAEEVTLVPHRPAGKRLLTVATVAAVFFVAGGAFAGAMVQPYLAERALVATKLDIARTAADAITTLWTYTPDDMGMLADRASRYLGGDFAGEYRKYIDAIVEPNKQAQVTNTTEVMGAAVETVAPPGTPSEATAIVYTNSVATSPVTKNIPSLRYLSYRLTMQRAGSRWLITRMTTVTSFDLTPQL